MCDERGAARKARDLVRDTTLPLGQIGEAVGFDSLSHFSRCYVEAFEVRPSFDRKRNFTSPGRGMREPAELDGTSASQATRPVY